METIKKVSALDPSDVSVVERVFGRRLASAENAVLILRVQDDVQVIGPDQAGLPAWCNVLDGFGDEDLADFQALLESPVQLGRAAE